LHSRRWIRSARCVTSRNDRISRTRGLLQRRMNSGRTSKSSHTCPRARLRLWVEG
jgi:hypothetical protein